MPSETLDLRGNVPKILFTDADRAYLADPKNYYWAFTMEHLDQSKATKPHGRPTSNTTSIIQCCATCVSACA
jgi:hypothetical protein